MHIHSDIDELRALLATWRKQDQAIALVPTMGNLHAGHLRLVDEARHHADRVVVSIFVNPLQFGEGEDYEKYPRTRQQDIDKLRKIGCDTAFFPEANTVYPREKDRMCRVEVPGLSEILCGQFRPRHFVGVTTVVNKLFNIVQPDIAIFGKKDFQQFTIIRCMVEDLNIPIRLIGVPTIREADGLAMSSRNGYLNDEQRQVAPRLYIILKQIADRIKSGERDYASLQRQALELLQLEGFRPDYFEVRRGSDLQQADDQDTDLVILAAAYLGRTRLIDNIELALV